MKRLLVFAFIGTLFAGCGHKIVNPGNVATGKDKVLSAYAGWVKDKGKKYDLDFHLRNDSDKPIIVFLADLTCMRGDVQGVLKHTFFNTGERTINIRPGAEKSSNMVCNLGTKTKGDFKITVKNVFSNPSGDGVNAGQVIAKDITWTQADK
jgi:hypothetical protein